MKDSERAHITWQRMSSSPFTFGALGLGVTSLAVVVASRFARSRRKSYAVVPLQGADLERQAGDDSERLLE